MVGRFFYLNFRSNSYLDLSASWLHRQDLRWVTEEKWCPPLSYFHQELKYYPRRWLIYPCSQGGVRVEYQPSRKPIRPLSGIYVMSWIIYSFSLTPTYDLLEDRCINDVTIDNILIFFSFLTNIYIYVTGNRSRKTLKWDKNVSETPGCTSSAAFLLLPHFGFIFNLLLKNDVTN